MKVDDAPPPGWYPDPTGGSRLWWWDGSDWTDERRAPPNPGAELLAEVEARAAARQAEDVELPVGPVPQRRALSRTETQDIITEVRQVARSEIDRAADVFSQRAQDATRRIEPLIGQYTGDLFRWIRIAVITGIVLLVTWFVLQTVAQASLMDWLGDRVDNVLNGN